MNKARNFDRLIQIVQSLMPYSSFIERTTINHGLASNVAGVAPFIAGSMYIAVIEATMSIVVLIGGYVRLPLVNLTLVGKSELRDILKLMKVI